MSLILYISLGKIQKFTIYREIAINLGKTKKRKGLFHIYKESGQSTKEYIGNTGARYIINGYLLYIGILSGEHLKRKSVYFLYIRRKSIYRKIHKFWAK